MTSRSDGVPRTKLTVLPYLETQGDGVRLLGTQCRSCGFNTFPPTTVCPSCMGMGVEPLRLSAQGTLYSFTTIRHGKAEIFGGYVDFPEKVRVFGHLAGFTVETPPKCDLAVSVRPGNGPSDEAALQIDYLFAAATSHE